MVDETLDPMKGDRPFEELTPMGDFKIAPAHGIAAVALNMAMKYHDINMIKDGALYQQYKLEGRNFRDLHLDQVFETAIKIEMHLLASSQRIADIVVEALEHRMEEDKKTTEPPKPDAEPKGD